jgi:putative transposase
MSYSTEMRSLFIEFRQMVNDAISVGLEKNLTSKFALCGAVFRQFGKKYNLHSWYRLSAFDIAISCLKNYRRKSRRNLKTRKPYVSRLFATLGSHAFKIQNGVLNVPIQPKKFIQIPLNNHIRSTLSSDPAIRCVSITLSENYLSVALRKNSDCFPATGYQGIDRNLDNVSVASSDNSSLRFDTSEITRMKENYSIVKSHVLRNDIRVRKRLFSKYGKLQSDKESNRLHTISKTIVESAKRMTFGIVMEDIKGLRKLFRRGTSKSRRYRRRLNSWSFYKLQKMIEYKSRWEGVPII